MIIRVLEFIQYVISLYWYVILASVVMSWLIGFNVVNAYNPTVRAIWNALQALTEPLLQPIRRLINRILPNLRGVDISPIFLLLGLMFLNNVVIDTLKDLAR